MIFLGVVKEALLDNINCKLSRSWLICVHDSRAAIATLAFGTINIQMHGLEHVDIVLGGFNLRELLKGFKELSVKKVLTDEFGPAAEETVLFENGLVHELEVDFELDVGSAVVVAEEHAVTHDALKLVVLAPHGLLLG